MAAHGVTDSRIVRLDEARRNEQLVLAESTLRGERTACAVRIFAIAAVSVTQEVAARSGAAVAPLGYPRAITIFLYGATLISLWWWMGRAKPSGPMPFVGPLIAMVADFAFITMMSVRNWIEEGTAEPERAAIFIALALTFSMLRHHWVHTVVSWVLACSAWIGVSLYVENPRGPSIAFVVALYAAMAALMWITRRQIAKMFIDLRKRDHLSRFLAPQVAQRLAEGGEAAFLPIQREVTVMFTDIRDFTRFSEALPPKAVLDFLDEIFGRIGEVVSGHDGMVNKFLGDGMLAVWGVPEPMEGHAAAAVRCALDLRTVLASINEERTRSGAPPIRMGIGLHSGTVAAGMLGGTKQHEYAVIGDAVNLASRIEGLTKEHGTDLLISGRTLELLGGRFATELVAETHVKGRAEAVRVYRVSGPAASRPAGALGDVSRTG